MNKRAALLFSILFIILVTSATSLEKITSSFIRAPAGSFSVQDFPPVIEASDYIGDPGDLVTIYANATDPNGKNVTITFNTPLNSSAQWQSTVNDSGITYTSISASDGTTQSISTVAIKLRPYCGDDNCSNGESCSSCSADCGTCPVPPSEDGGAAGGGGGGGGGGWGAYPWRGQQADDFNADLKELFIELQEGESVNKELIIDNNIGKNLLLRVDITGDIANCITVDPESLVFPLNSDKALDLLALDLLVSANKPAGTYKGEITLLSGNTQQVIPITLNIVPGDLQLSLDLLTPKVDLGQALKFRINIDKTSLATEDVSLMYLVTGSGEISVNFLTGATVADIEQLSEQKQDLIYQEETIPVEGTISLSKEIEIPVDFPTGEYTLNINAKFDGKNIPLTANFSVKTPWYAQRMLGIEKGIVAIIIIIIVLLCVILFLLDARSKRHKN